MIGESHQVYTVSYAAAVVKKTAKKVQQNSYQGPHESIIAYKERFDVCFQAQKDQDSPELTEIDVAIDFYGLGIGSYDAFKATI